MGMYFKDKTEVFKVRFTKQQLDYLENLSSVLGCSMSQALRMIIDTVRNGDFTNENKQTYFND